MQPTASQQHYADSARRGLRSVLGWITGLAVAAALLLMPAARAWPITAPELRGANANPAIDTNMHGMALQQAEYIKANLEGVDLSASDLTGAVFNSSNLVGADLRDANLTDVVAFASRFDRANLEGAVLENGLFMQSSFQDASITDADFTDAVLDKTQQAELCQRAKGRNRITGRLTQSSLNCPGRT